MRLHRGLARALPLLLAGAGCHAAPPSPSAPQHRHRLEIVTAAGDTVPLQAEIAHTPARRRRGLMERTDLPADAGMIFLFPEEQPASAGFWMHRTRIPLDIAYLGRTGVIVRTLQMEPCRALLSLFCRRYPPGVPFHAALEVNRGFFAARGISEGDRVRLEAIELPEARPAEGDRASSGDSSAAAAAAAR